MQVRAHHVLGEVQRVGAREERKETALVHAVVEQQLLLGVRRRLELPSAQRVLRRDRQCHLGGIDGAAADTDPSLDQGAEHGEEAAAGVLDRALVLALRGDVGEPVEEGLARHAYAVEPEAAVVDTVETHLAAVVLDPDARRRCTVDADRDDEGVHALRRAAHPQLGEDDSQFGVPGRVADVVLAGLVTARGDDELLGVDVVRRHRAECLDVGPVAGLGHRETAHQLPGDQVRQVGLVVTFGTELQDRAAEETELHTDLHQHRKVAEGERLERGDGGADVAATAVLPRKSHPGLAGRRQLDDEPPHAFAEVVDAELFGLVENGGVRDEIGADEIADLRVFAVEHGAQGTYVDVGLHVAVLVREGVSDHGALLPRLRSDQAMCGAGVPPVAQLVTFSPVPIPRMRPCWRRPPGGWRVRRGAG